MLNLLLDSHIHFHGRGTPIIGNVHDSHCHPRFNFLLPELCTMPVFDSCASREKTCNLLEVNLPTVATYFPRRFPKSSAAVSTVTDVHEKMYHATSHHVSCTHHHKINTSRKAASTPFNTCKALDSIIRNCRDPCREPLKSLYPEQAPLPKTRGKL